MRKRESDVASLQNRVDGQPLDNGETYHLGRSLDKSSSRIYRG